MWKLLDVFFCIFSNTCCWKS